MDLEAAAAAAAAAVAVGYHEQARCVVRSLRQMEARWTTAPATLADNQVSHPLPYAATATATHLHRHRDCHRHRHVHKSRSHLARVP